MGVENIEEELENIVKYGAKQNSEIQDVGEGIKLVTIIDPLGNILGIIENPHFKLE